MLKAHSQRIHLVKNWPRSILKCNQTCLAQVPHLTMTDLKLSVLFFFVLFYRLVSFYLGSRAHLSPKFFFLFFTDICVNNPAGLLRCAGTAARTHRSICVLSMRYYFARTKLSVVCAQPRATNCIWGWRDREGFLFWKWIDITCKPTLKRHDSCLTAPSSSGGPAPHIDANILYQDPGLHPYIIKPSTRCKYEDFLWNKGREWGLKPFAGRWAAGGGMGELVSTGSQPSDEEALKPERAKWSYVIQRGRDGIMEEGDY